MIKILRESEPPEELGQHESLHWHSQWGEGKIVDRFEWDDTYPIIDKAQNDTYMDNKKAFVLIKKRKRLNDDQYTYNKEADKSEMGENIKI